VKKREKKKRGGKRPRGGKRKVFQFSVAPRERHREEGERPEKKRGKSGVLGRPLLLSGGRGKKGGGGEGTKKKGGRKTPDGYTSKRGKKRGGKGIGKRGGGVGQAFHSFLGKGEKKGLKGVHSVTPREKEGRGEDFKVKKKKGV